MGLVDLPKRTEGDIRVYDKEKDISDYRKIIIELYSLPKE